MKRTALEITSQSFPVVRRGFDPGAVRAYLALLGDEAERAAADGEPDGRTPDPDLEARLAAAEAAVAEAEAGRVQATLRAVELERQLRNGAQSTGALLADAEREAAAIVEAARREADEIHRTRWQEAGTAVSRVLEAADLEARRLVDGAESLALQIRGQVESEVSARRAESDRAAEQTRLAVADARAEGERMEVERTVRVEAALEEAKSAVRQHIEEDLARARGQVDALRAQETEVAGRLQRVRDLVVESLTVAESATRSPRELDAESLLQFVHDADPASHPRAVAAVPVASDQDHAPTTDGAGDDAGGEPVAGVLHGLQVDVAADGFAAEVDVAGDVATAEVLEVPEVDEPSMGPDVGDPTRRFRLA